MDNSEFLVIRNDNEYGRLFESWLDAVSTIDHLDEGTGEHSIVRVIDGKLIETLLGEYEI